MRLSLDLMQTALSLLLLRSLLLLLLLSVLVVLGGLSLHLVPALPGWPLVGVTSSVLELLC